MNQLLEFQIYDWMEDHEKPMNNFVLGNYIIHIFGRTMDDHSVYAKVKGFQPYFYIELPEDWKED